MSRAWTCVTCGTRSEWDEGWQYLRHMPIPVHLRVFCSDECEEEWIESDEPASDEERRAWLEAH